jgi:hypothetical protein
MISQQKLGPEFLSSGERDAPPRKKAESLMDYIISLFGLGERLERKMPDLRPWKNFEADAASAETDLVLADGDLLRYLIEIPLTSEF